MGGSGSRRELEGWFSGLWACRETLRDGLRDTVGGCEDRTLRGVLEGHWVGGETLRIGLGGSGGTERPSEVFLGILVGWQGP